MMMKNILILLSLVSNTALADSFLDSVKRMKWGDLEVVWIEDNKFPRFVAAVYFQDGATSDSLPGLTQATFDQLSSGTSQAGEKEIAEFFDFYGATLRHTVTHEYSVFNVQALTKDMDQVMGKVCSLFTDAQFPQKELTSYVSRSSAQLKNLVTSHSSLADRVFRQVSLKQTPYSLPVEGTLEGFKKLSIESLQARLKQLNQVQKKIYLAGPKSVLGMKDIILNKCQWKSEGAQSIKQVSRPTPESSIYLVPVPGANQAQIRIGRYVTGGEVEGKYDQFNFLAGFLGGGFTSKLVQELRVKRGLTYSAGAYVSMQRDYGRAGIMTFSKNESAAQAISIVRDVFMEVAEQKFTAKEFKHQQGHKVGNFLFGFEETNSFLAQIMLYDHQQRDLRELENFPQTISSLTPTSLAQACYEVFPWDRLTIVVVGDRSLEKSLSRIRPVRILDYRDFL
jgi:zinc protease